MPSMQSPTFQTEQAIIRYFSDIFTRPLGVIEQKSDLDDQAALVEASLLALSKLPVPQLG